MPYKPLTVSVTANQDTELCEVIGALVQELDDLYILIEREDGKLAVLRVSHLAWLPYGKTLADLEQYFLPTHELDSAGLTDGEIGDVVDAHPDEVVLLYHGDEFLELVVAPPPLGPGGGGNCRKVECQNCKRKVTLCGNRKRCPRCGKNAV